MLQVCHTNIENFTNMNQGDRFVEIMKKRDDKIIAALGKYLHNSMTKRHGFTPNAPPNRKHRKH